MKATNRVMIVGGGIAGSEAAWQLAQRGIGVDLYEMRPVKPTAAHQTEHFSELVCSNSFGSDVLTSASRILKDEIAAMGSLVISAARECSVPAGASLAVDRNKFSNLITHLISSQPSINIFRQEVTELPRDRIVILASGPLTSAALSDSLTKLLGASSLYFYDAISPIVEADSLDLSQMYFANRYDKGDSADFLNIPMTETQYEELVSDLLSGEVLLPHDFEEEKYFEGCMPIEVLASRGRRTLAFGPMKPVGLRDPRTGKLPHAVIQLRAENRYKTAYNLVGFQTKLRYKEQERIFRKIPGLAQAEFLRLGSMHRNTYIDSPKHLRPTLQLKNNPLTFIAGQLTGTEGYLESAAGGLVAGINAAQLMLGLDTLTLPSTTMLGALLFAITDETKTQFQPMNANMGILPPEEGPKTRDKKVRYHNYANRSQRDLVSWLPKLSRSVVGSSRDIVETAWK